MVNFAVHYVRLSFNGKCEDRIESFTSLMKQALKELLKYCC